MPFLSSTTPRNVKRTRRPSPACPSTWNLPLYLELAHVSGLIKAVRSHLQARKKRPEDETEAWAGDEVIRWLNQRCGRSEAAHATMKSELAGGKVPSGEFGKNVAWWWTMILAFNLNAAMKRLVLGGSWVHRGLKAIRFHLIAISGRIIRGGRELKLRIGRGFDTLKILLDARTKMQAWALAG